jgi:transposase
VVDPISARFVYRHQKEYFNHKTYIEFLDQSVLSSFYKKNNGRLFLIQDNASYHKKPETYDWFKENRKYIEVQCLPPYHPELNAAECVWKHTRKTTTHNQYHEKEENLQNALFKTFSKIQKQPNLIKGLMRPFL